MANRNTFPELAGELGLPGLERLEGGKDLKGEEGASMAVDGTPSTFNSKSRTSLDRFLDLLAADTTKKVCIQGYIMYCKYESIFHL